MDKIYITIRCGKKVQKLVFELAMINQYGAIYVDYKKEKVIFKGKDKAACMREVAKDLQSDDPRASLGATLIDYIVHHFEEVFI